MVTKMTANKNFILAIHTPAFILKDREAKERLERERKAKTELYEKSEN